MTRPSPWLCASLLATVLATAPAVAGDPSAEGAKIRFVIADETLSATLEDNSASRDFLSRLPLEVEMTDYASTEKIFYPKPKLSTDNVPEGTAADAGDITYYAPWGDVALFYRDFGYSSGLVRLGRFEDAKAVRILSKKGPVTARIEAIR